MSPKQTLADGLHLASGLSGLLLDCSRGTLSTQREERRSPAALPLAIRAEADGNLQTASTRGAKRQSERDVKRELIREQESQTPATDGEQFVLSGLKQTNIETKDHKGGLKKKRRTKQQPVDSNMSF